MAKIQLDDIKAEIEKDGWKLISTEYKNLDTIMEFVCSEGHQVFAPWKKFVCGVNVLSVKTIHIKK